jgi:hypothetical protein
MRARKNALKASRDSRLCECRCGEHLTGLQRRYKPGHESKARRKHAREGGTRRDNVRWHESVC